MYKATYKAINQGIGIISVPFRLLSLAYLNMDQEN